uniref:Secreted protein n=1 Tax=Amblyomma cajennense TaxID=34607 RepID=A0A023FSX3_AMBCJ
MSSLTSLALVAFIASTLLLVEAAKDAKKARPGEPLVLKLSYFHDCKEPQGKCNDPDPCFCRPPTGYIRNEGYFYSDEYKKCIKPRNGVGEGCNSFKTYKECWRKCERKYSGRKYILQNEAKN